MCPCLILAEVLQGFRSDTDHRTAKNLLLDLNLHVLGGTEIAQKAADNFRTLRKKGITVRKTVDCFIATYCNRAFSTATATSIPSRSHLGLKAVLPFEC